jgi:hypothetical protein
MQGDLPGDALCLREAGLTFLSEDISTKDERGNGDNLGGEKCVRSDR